MMQRRDVLKGGLAVAGAGMLAGSWPAMAQSAGSTDYRALVCVFLFGGNDANNMVVPLDETRHASYRRAPADGAAWFNPGCRSRVVRGGSWASSPAQARAAWRSSSDSDMTNARVGFRVVRGI